jgi:hypothetical protein
VSTAPFVGYPAQVWGACWQALSWLSTQFANAPAVAPAAALETPVTAVFATLWNGLAALSAWQTGTALALESQNFNAVQSLPTGLDAVTQNYIAVRAGACAEAALQISALPPAISLLNVSAPLAAGQPVIADPKFLEWCMAFAGEPAPTLAALPGAAQLAANAWLSAANAIFVLQGSALSPAYDAAVRQYRCASVIATILQQTQSGGFSGANVTSAPIPMTDDQGNPITDDLGNIIYISSGTEGTSTWSTTVALPTLLLDAASLASVPSSLASQQISVIRYVLMSQVLQLAQLLLSFRSKTVLQPSTGYLRNAESLMDFAARTTGDFENWANIAVLNGVSPPYPGPTNPALALQGKPLFTAGTPAGTNTQATYANNVLGTDWDLGPINGAQPPWLGDLSLITGYLNFARAIGRRLQTPLGSLVFHQGYGCSIPAEIGAIQSTDESARLTEYAKSAIRGDPRLGSILSANTVLAPGFSANVQVALTPIGPGASPVGVSEVIGARP